MSDFQPALDDYPGYFPAAKPPFWTRAKVGAAAGVAGLLLGVGMGSSSSTDAADLGASFTQADLDRAVDAAVTDAQGQAEASQADNDGAAAKVEALRAQLRQQKADAAATLRKVKREARAAQRTAVARAVAQAKADASSSSPQQFAGTSGETDPRFDFCYEANDAGYGDYVEGQDPEYQWYDDADNDGIVCER